MQVEEHDKYAVIAITTPGITLARTIITAFNYDGYTTDKLYEPGFTVFDDFSAEFMKMLFKKYVGILFICNIEDTVRLIAPHVTRSFNNPSVLVTDEKGGFVVSLLSGRFGSANEWVRQIADFTRGMAVNTSITMAHDIASLDLIIQEVGASLEWHRDDIRIINQMLMRGKKVGLYCEHVHISNIAGFILIADLHDTIPEDLTALVVISPKVLPKIKSMYPVIQIIPKILVLGISSDTAMDERTLHNAVVSYVKSQDFLLSAIREVGSDDQKQNISGLTKLAMNLNVPLRVFSDGELRTYRHIFSASLRPATEKLTIAQRSQLCAWVLSHRSHLGSTLKYNSLSVSIGIGVGRKK